MPIQLAEVERTFRSLGDCEQTASGLLKCVRRDPAGGQLPLSIYWIDTKENLPENDQALTDYQRSIFGRSYYEMPKALQLNQYLLFLVDEETSVSPDFDATRRRIESDLSFARKFIFTKDGLDKYVKNLRDAFGPPSRLEGPTDRWVEALNVVGLAGIYENRQRAGVIRSIEDGTIGPAAIDEGALIPAVSKPPKPLASPEKVPFLEKVHLLNMGEHPKERVIDLAPVTLICGENGAGKSTILEAIELAFCGENLRAPRKVVGRPDAAVEFVGKAGLTKFGTTSKERLALDLNWFGSYSRQNAKLEYSFNRYVFFNADSSYALQYTESEQTIANAINRLVLGEAANLMWGRIEEYETELRKTTVTRDNEYANAVSRQGTLTKLMAELSGPTTAIEEVFQRAIKSLKALKFRSIPENEDQIGDDLIQSVSQLHDRLSELAGLTAWIPSANFSTVEERGKQIEKQLVQIQDSDQKHQKYSQALESNKTECSAFEKRLMSLHRYQVYLRNGWMGLLQDVAALEKSEKEYSELMQLDKQLQRSLVAQTDLDRTVDEVLVDEKGKNEVYAHELQSARSALEARERDVSERERMLSQIRSLARTYLDFEAHAKECPVCATAFGAGELRKRVGEIFSAAAPTETSLVALSQAVQLSQKKFDELQSRLVALQVVHKIGSLLAARRPRSSIKTLLDSLDARLADGIAQSARLNGLRQSIQNLTQSGLSDSEFRGLRDLIPKAVASLDVEKQEQWIASETKKVNLELDKLGKRRVELQLEVEKLVRNFDQWRTTYQLSEGDASDLLVYVRQISQRIGRTQELFSEISHVIRITREEEFQSRVLAASVARDRVREYFVAQEQEKRRQSELQKLKLSEEAARKSRDVAKLKAQRVGKAYEAIVEIKKTHSLAHVAGDFFAAHLKRINTIFQNIHSPKEFSEVLVNLDSAVGDSGIRLRRNDGVVVEVGQISTGQRAALALSIFFTLNEKLSSGPSLILLDDPVVNIDDLNAIAFFDYLREVALTKRRQIVFVTANDRMANLFEKKFEFLNGAFASRTISRNRALEDGAEVSAH
jgi:exonuclease SbcC